jgi:tRNA pseudouridine38-40 synthase
LRLWLQINIVSKQRNIKLVIAYQGTRYKGWQRQPDVTTVQETIELILTQFLARPVQIRGASRTDAGVHAEGQVANFVVEDCPIPTHAFADILNGKLPDDIAVRSSVEVPLEFQASRDALHKTYHYRIFNSGLKDVMYHNVRWQMGHKLDNEAINRAASYLIGTHDFKGFTSARDEREDSVRTIYEARSWWSGESELTFMIRANRFLYLMVRNIVGTLVEIGRGHWPVDKMAEIIIQRDRTLAGPTAPPQGLCLKSIEYAKNLTSALDTEA